MDRIARRPELTGGHSRKLMPDSSVLLMMREAIKWQDGLIHGKLHHQGESCAVGAYLDENPTCSLSWELADQISAMNDSVAHYGKRKRKRFMLQWLRWKLQHDYHYPMPGRKTQKQKGWR